MSSMMQKVELLKQIASNPNIPSPPVVVMRVLDQASKPDCTIYNLCQIIQMDPGLSANILRTVNSALFGLSRPATSIQRALAIVGLNSARLLVLALSLPRTQTTLTVEPLVKQRYWKASIAGAIVAHELSKRLRRREPEDDMVAALLRDLGEVILQQFFPEAYQAVLQQAEAELIENQCQLEEAQCSLDHAEVSAFILNRWRLPPDITEAIQFHHHPEVGIYTSETAEQRAYLLHFATRSAQLLLYPDQPLVLRGLLESAQQRFAMDEACVREFLIPLGRKTTEFAALLQVDIGDANDYQAVLIRAGEELMKLTLAANRDQQDAQERTRQAEAEASHWKQEAALDPLTRAFNRRFLETRLRATIDRLDDPSRGFGILFIDLDGFKAINDRCGHSFGDFVLQQVADCLNRQVRQGDLVARYGGDEFCVLFESIDARGLQALGRRTWEKINALDLRQGPHQGKIGASIGAVCCDVSVRGSSAEALLAAADAAMYRAKTGGKNRVVFLEPLGGFDTASSDASPMCLVQNQATALT